MKLTTLKIIAAILMLIQASCGNKYTPITVDIPYEFEQNTEVKEFIAEYLEVVNEFKMQTLQIMKIAGVDKDTPNAELNEDNLSASQKIRFVPIAIKQMKTGAKHDELRQRMSNLLTTLEEAEQRALKGVIAKMDAHMGVVSPEGDAKTESQYVEQQLQNGNKDDQQQEEPEYLDEKEYYGSERELSQSKSQNEGSSLKIFWILFALLGIVVPIAVGLFLFSRFQKGRGIAKANAAMKKNIEEQLNRKDVDTHERSFSTSHIVGLQQLRQLYDTQLKDAIKGMETLRKKTKFYYALAIVLGIASYFLYQNYLFIVFGVTLIGTLVFLGIAGFSNFKYRVEYKDQVVSKVIHFINPDYEYDPDKRISLEQFNSSKILINEPNSCKGDDYVCGIIDKTFFEFCEFVAQNEYTSKDKDGNEKKEVITLFHGMFFDIDFNKHIKGETFVVPDNAERMLGKLGQQFQSDKRGELVKLENIEFEKHFAVFSTDQVEARYILTPTMMEALVNIRKNIGRSFYMSFIGEKVYCGIEFNKALFEPSIFKSVNFVDVAFMHSLFTLIETIITEMNLNTRIWTKE
jgi:hypothetical protein